MTFARTQKAEVGGIVAGFGAATGFKQAADMPLYSKCCLCHAHLQRSKFLIHSLQLGLKIVYYFLISV